MAVYTSLDPRELAGFLAAFGMDGPADCAAASDGIENSTYFLQQGGQAYVLTLFEDLGEGELPFFIRLMGWMRAAGLPVACPLADRQQQCLHRLSDRPALLFPRLAGRHIMAVTPDQAGQVGRCLAAIHQHTATFPEQRENPRGTRWMASVNTRLAGRLSAADSALLQQQLDNAETLRALPLPSGIIHGDLFRDNALFHEGQLTGVIDFYNACTDMWALDLAIVFNDWCYTPAGDVLPAHARALLAGYEAVRPLEPLEREHWQALLQLAATRFWLSRLMDEEFPRHAGVQHAHKPSAEYRARLLQHRDSLPAI